VDDAADRIYFSTAPGAFSTVFDPQRPTVHALDAGTGAILWQNTAEANADASFAPTSAIPGVAFAGSVISGNLRAYDTATGEKLASIGVGFTAASAPVAIDGVLLVGAGIGGRTGDPSETEDITSRIPQDVTALCVPGTLACAADVPVAGRRLRVTDRAGEPDGRTLSVQGGDDALTAPAPGGPGDPSLAGARLDLLNPETGEAAALLLPASGWTALGKPEALKGFRYRDRDGVLGSCRRALVRDGRLRAHCKGGGIVFTLDEPAQSALAVALTVGTARVYCLRFGGVVADEGIGAKRRGRFVAKHAPAPVACPLP
jgi:hypothetical protein